MMECETTDEDIESVKEELEEVEWTFVRRDLAQILIETGDYSLYTTAERSFSEYVPVIANK